MTAPSIRVPYVIAWSEEAVQQKLVFVQHKLTGAVRLSYVNPRSTDWVHAETILRARVRVHRGGEPMWRMLNTRRQWECMEYLLCQVCARPARDPDGRIPWVVSDTVFKPLDPSGETALTNAPPTCRECIPEALGLCPQLRKSSTVYTVGDVRQVAVLGETFRPRRNGKAVQTGHNIEVGLEESWRLPYVLATQLIVKMYDIREETPPS